MYAFSASHPSITRLQNQTAHLHHSPICSPKAPPMMTKRIVRGFVFDMDGTLIEAKIDFHELRRRANILTGDLLEVMDGLPKAERERVAAVIEEVEDAALPRMAINDGVLELCKLLDDAKVPRALLTRNTARAVSYFHDNHFSLPPFKPALARDFKPYKPSPAAILHICREWGIPPSEAVMVGDSLKDDIVAGNRAGAMTIFLDIDGTAAKDVEREEEKPDFIASSMCHFTEMLQRDFELVAWQQK